MSTIWMLSILYFLDDRIYLVTKNLASYQWQLRTRSVSIRHNVLYIHMVMSLDRDSLGQIMVSSYLGLLIHRMGSRDLPLPQTCAFLFNVPGCSCWNSFLVYFCALFSNCTSFPGRRGILPPECARERWQALHLASAAYVCVSGRHLLGTPSNLSPVTQWQRQPRPACVALFQSSGHSQSFNKGLLFRHMMPDVAWVPLPVALPSATRLDNRKECFHPLWCLISSGWGATRHQMGIKPPISLHRKKWDLPSTWIIHPFLLNKKFWKGLTLGPPTFKSWTILLSIHPGDIILTVLMTIVPMTRPRPPPTWSIFGAIRWSLIPGNFGVLFIYLGVIPNTVLRAYSWCCIQRSLLLGFRGSYAPWLQDSPFHYVNNVECRVWVV